jgi:hypothetical protein
MMLAMQMCDTNAPRVAAAALSAGLLTAVVGVLLGPDGEDASAAASLLHRLSGLLSVQVRSMLCACCIPR